MSRIGVYILKTYVSYLCNTEIIDPWKYDLQAYLSERNLFAYYKFRNISKVI